MPLCACCGVEYSERTIDRHLVRFRDRLERQLDLLETQAGQATNDAAPAPVPGDDDGDAPENGDFHLGDVGMDGRMGADAGEGKLA
jgi:hypothetical protein